METPSTSIATTSSRASWSRPWQLVALVAIAGAISSYYLKVAHNPPGYYIDEASIPYYAHLISQTGRDETGPRWPLYFRAFGDYKNPVYIYLLAGVYSLTGRVRVRVE